MRFFGQRSDADIVGLVLAGQHEQFSELVRRHLPMAQAIAAARIHNAHDIEDIVQDAFLNAYRSLDTLRDLHHFAGWLASIVRNACANYHRAQHARRMASQIDVLDEPEVEGPEREELRRLLRSRLATLDEASRDILLLHYYAEQSTRQIAETLQLSREAVKKRLQRAREALGQAVMRELEPSRDELTRRGSRVSAIMAAIRLSPVPWAKTGAASASAVASASALTFPLLAGLAATIVLVTVIPFTVLRRSQEPATAQTPVSVTSTSVASPGSGNARDPLNAVAASAAAGSPIAGSGAGLVAPAAPRDRMCSVSGVLVNIDTKEPIPNVDVVLYQGDIEKPTARTPVAQTVRTSPKGRFTFNSLPAHAYTAAVLNPWFVASRRLCVLSNEEPNADITLELQPASIVAGRVYDQESGRGIPGIEVAVENGPSSITNVDGAYTLGGLRGPQRITRGFTGSYACMVEGEDKRLEVPVGQEVTGIDFPVGRGIRIHGATVDGSGKPFGKVALRFAVVNTSKGFDVNSNDDGAFTVSNLPQRSRITYDLGPASSEQGLSVALHREVTLGAEDLRGLTIGVQTAATLSGRIVSSKGVGIPNAAVDLAFRWPDSSGHVSIGPATDKEGRFASQPLYPGTYTLTLTPPARADGSRPLFKELETITLQPGEHRSDLRYVYDSDAGLSIAGRILDASGKPLPGVSFSVTGNGSEMVAKTDKSGQFLAPGLEEGIYDLVYFRLNGIVYYESEHVAAGTQDVEIRLQLKETPKSGGPVGGRVLDARTQEPIKHFGYHLASGVYDILDPNSDHTDFWGTIYLPLPHQITDNDGLFSLTTYSVVPHTLLVMAPGYAPHISAVTPGSSDNTIALQPGAAVDGLVLDPKGQPVQGAYLIRGTFTMLHMYSAASDAGSGRVVGVTRADGSFHIDELNAEPQVYSAVHKAYGLVSKTVTPATDQPTRVTFQFPPAGSIEGVITVDGRPGKGAGLELALNDRGRGNFWCDDAGKYRIEGIPPAQYKVTYCLDTQSPGHVLHWRKELTTDIGPGAPNVSDVDFPEGNATLTGVVTLDGQPLSQIVSVRIGYAALGISGSTELDIQADGSYAISGLPPGEAIVHLPERVKKATIVKNEIDVLIPSSGTVSANLELHTR